MWAKSSLEAKEGHSKGPICNPAKVSKLLGTDKWIPNRRFGLKQGGANVRRIDDITDQNVNFSST